VGAPAFRDLGGNTNYQVVGNTGYNPVGVITNPFTSNTIGLNGINPGPVASTTYTVIGVPIFVEVVSCTGATVTIKDSGGTNVYVNTGCAGPPSQTISYLDVGWTINFGGYSAISVVVSGH
jgi:hypothetical protein